MSAPKVKIKNSSGSEIPARSFVQVSSSETLSNNETVYVVDQPGTAGSGIHFVTGHLKIANGSIGYGYDVNFGDAWVKYSTAPTPIEEVGPASLSWECAPTGTGFDAIKNDTGSGLVLIRGRSGGGGDCTCPEIHEFSTNGATSGTFSTTYTLDADSDIITWDWDASASEVQTAFEAGSLFTSGDVTVSGGDWPNVAIYVKFNTYAWSRTYVPTVDNSSLVGGKGFMRKFSEQG